MSKMWCIWCTKFKVTIEDKIGLFNLTTESICCYVPYQSLINPAQMKQGLFYQRITADII